MENNKYDILTVKETAEFLRVPCSTVYKLAQGGLMPAQKVGRHWRFHRATLIDWIVRRDSAESALIGSSEATE